MCGIAGFVSATGNGSTTTLERMTEVIRHRGPDDAGLYEDGIAWLGHRRLSIIDLEGGHQPMTSEDGRLWIVYNGEIFNHAVLRRELEDRNHRYRTRSDTETILHAYEEYGTACVEHFRGMFAFAIWDREKRTLYCARDRLGIKPFYYHWDGRDLVFASEIKALLKHPRVQARLDEKHLGEYLSFGYLSGEEALFQGVRKLSPGHWMRLRVGDSAATLESKQYWDVPEEPRQEENVDEEAWIEECRRRLEETVEMRLMSDVPLGVFLSGGVDSSAIAALMARMVSGRVKSFSVGYQEKAYSELDSARTVAEHVGTDHHEVVVGKEDFFNALPQLIWQEDEPITWPSSVSLYFLSQLAAQHVKVVLTGEGSDELFGGYSRYRLFLWNQQLMRYYGRVPGGLRRWIRGQIEGSPLLTKSLRRKLGHTVLGRNCALRELLLENSYSAFSSSGLSRLLATPQGSFEDFMRHWERYPQASALSRMLYVDQKTYLVELLMKQDQMSMASSIESRVPLLDHPLVEFAARVPQALKLRKGNGKYIIKKSVEDLVPRAVIYQRKIGFSTPLRQWLQEPSLSVIAALLTKRDTLLADCLDRAELQALIERHRSGFEDATDRLWRLLNLQLWGEIFLFGRQETYRTGILGQGASRRIE